VGHASNLVRPSGKAKALGRSDRVKCAR
jgi:hypothetical protein